MFVVLGLAPSGAAGAAAAGQAGDHAKRHTIPELVRAMSPAVVYIGNVEASGHEPTFGAGFV